MVEHTAHAFDVDLQELARKIAEMGGLAEKQIVDAIDALVKHDIALAKRVIAADDQVDARQREVEKGRSSLSHVGNRWRSICGRSSERYASPTTSSGLAI